MLQGEEVLTFPPAFMPYLRAAHERREARERMHRWMDDGMRGDTTYGVTGEWVSEGPQPSSPWKFDHSKQQEYFAQLCRDAGLDDAPEPTPTELAVQQRALWAQRRNRRRQR